MFRRPARVRTTRLRLWNVRVESVERVHDANDAVRLRKDLQDATTAEPWICITHDRGNAFAIERLPQAARDFSDSGDISDAVRRDSELFPLIDRLTADAENLADRARRSLKCRPDGGQCIRTRAAVGMFALGIRDQRGTRGRSGTLT